MTNPNDSTFPCTDTIHPETHERCLPLEQGLTKREYFACHLTVNMDEYAYQTIKQLMDSEVPKDSLGKIKWWMEAEARMKVLKADALINVLNQQK